ncbi:hypothetical protein Holit_02276 [Hollandina sp. SP2]
MKKNMVFVLRMLAALLAFGLVLAGCDSGGGSFTIAVSGFAVGTKKYVYFGWTTAYGTSASGYHAIQGTADSKGVITVTYPIDTQQFKDAAKNKDTIYIFVDNYWDEQSKITYEFGSTTVSLSYPNDFE